MRVKIKRLALSLSLTVLGLAVPRALRADAPVISGFVDTTYNYNFNKPSDQTNALRSFDSKANNFALNAAQIQAAGTLGDAGYVIKLLAGTDALFISPSGAGGAATSNGTIGNGAGATGADYIDVEEAYLTYKLMPNLNAKVGKFVTLEGIEVIESKDNPTISRGCLFGMAEPFTHVGGLLDYTFGKMDVGAGVVNGWDTVSDNNRGKTVIGKVGFNWGDPFALTISGLYGPEQSQPTDATSTQSTIQNNRSSIDAVLITKIIPKVTLNLQGNYGREDRAFDANGNGIIDSGDKADTWSGAGIQPVVSITNKFSIGGRLEYMYDQYGSRMATLVPAGAVTDHLASTNFTVTPAYKLTDNTTVRLEYRYDKTNRKIFLDDKGVLKDNNSTVSAEWILTF